MAPKRLARRRLEHTRWAVGWLAHMWAYKVAFEVPYDRADHLRARLRIDNPITLDRRIGLGTPPPQRLQRRLRRPPQLTLLDRAANAVYLLREAEPHLALAWLLLRHPGRFPGAAVRMAATFDSTLIGYFAIPTAPPWWASEFMGRMDGEVRRVNMEVIRSLQGGRRPGTPEDHEPGSTPLGGLAVGSLCLRAQRSDRAGRGRCPRRGGRLRLRRRSRARAGLHRRALRLRPDAGSHAGARDPCGRLRAPRAGSESDRSRHAARVEVYASQAAPTLNGLAGLCRRTLEGNWREGRAAR